MMTEYLQTVFRIELCTYSELAFWAQLLILVVAMILMLLMMFSFLVIIRERKWHISHTLTLLGVIASILVAICLRSMISTAYRRVEIPFVRDWPWYVFSAIQLAQIVYLAHRRYINRRYQVTSLGRDSIREAIENIPMGLAFSDQTGRMILTNRMLYRMLGELLEQTPNNMERVWETLAHGEPSPITRSGADGRTYQLFREEIVVQGKPYIQTTINDITGLHELYLQVEQNNAVVAQQRREMKNFADRVIQSNHEEEVLQRKIQIHNEMGQNILATRQLLLSRGALEEYHENARNWYQIASGFSKIAGQKPEDAKAQLKEILEVASQIGCEVNLSEHLMPELVRSSLIRQSIREAIVNAVRHGQATSLSIQPLEENGYVGLVISNNGKLPETTPVLSGGLKNLSEALIALDGELQICVEGEWQLRIKLPKGALGALT